MKTQLDIPCDRETVSALMDGQLSGAQAAMAVQSMASAEARECWHVYHLVGDVLRSTDLAACGHDTAFVARLAARLQHETSAFEALPALAKPAMLDVARPAANDGVFRWKLVAGVASLAAVMAVSWSVLGGASASSGGTAAGPQMALMSPPGGVSLVNAVQPADQPTAVVVNTAQGPVLRDARLEQLLADHRQYGGMSALQMPAGFLRDATHTAAPQR